MGKIQGETNQGVLSGWWQSGESAVTAVAGILSGKEDSVSDEPFLTPTKHHQSRLKGNYAITQPDQC